MTAPETIERKARAEALNWAISTINEMRYTYTLDAIMMEIENARDYNLMLVKEAEE